MLENTFSSLPDVAAGHFRILPVGRMMTTRLDSLSKIRDYHGPLLQTHGDADQVVPFALGKRLFAAANPPKKFIPVPGGGHNDPPSREFLAALDEFLETLPAAGGVRRGRGTPMSDSPLTVVLLTSHPAEEHAALRERLAGRGIDASILSVATNCDGVLPVPSRRWRQIFRGRRLARRHRDAVPALIHAFGLRDGRPRRWSWPCDGSGRICWRSTSSSGRARASGWPGDGAGG